MIFPVNDSLFGAVVLSVIDEEDTYGYKITQTGFWISLKNTMIFKWTVNKTSKVKKLYQMPVDGIVTDFTQKAKEIINRSDIT